MLPLSLRAARYHVVFYVNTIPLVHNAKQILHTIYIFLLQNAFMLYLFSVMLKKKNIPAAKTRHFFVVTHSNSHLLLIAIAEGLRWMLSSTQHRNPHLWVLTIPFFFIGRVFWNENESTFVPLCNVFRVKALKVLYVMVESLCLHLAHTERFGYILYLWLPQATLDLGVFTRGTERAMVRSKKSFVLGGVQTGWRNCDSQMWACVTSIIYLSVFCFSFGLFFICVSVRKTTFFFKTWICIYFELMCLFELMCSIPLRAVYFGEWQCEDNILVCFFSSRLHLTQIVNSI